MVNKALFTSNTEEWATPQAFFEELNKEFNFTLDPCATQENAKCKKYFTKEQNGLLQSWAGETVFAIRLTEGKLKIGLKKRTRKRKAGQR